MNKLQDSLAALTPTFLMREHFHVSAHQIPHMLMLQENALVALLLPTGMLIKLPA